VVFSEAAACQACGVNALLHAWPMAHTIAFRFRETKLLAEVVYRVRKEVRVLKWL
jgi:hypothetical protein